MTIDKKINLKAILKTLEVRHNLSEGTYLKGWYFDKDSKVEYTLNFLSSNFGYRNHIRLLKTGFIYGRYIF